MKVLFDFFKSKFIIITAAIAVFLILYGLFFGFQKSSLNLLDYVQDEQQDPWLYVNFNDLEKNQDLNFSSYFNEQINSYLASKFSSSYSPVWFGKEEMIVSFRSSPWLIFKARELSGFKDIQKNSKRLHSFVYVLPDKKIYWAKKGNLFFLSVDIVQIDKLVNQNLSDSKDAAKTFLKGYLPKDAVTSLFSQPLSLEETLLAEQNLFVEAKIQDKKLYFNITPQKEASQISLLPSFNLRPEFLQRVKFFFSIKHYYPQTRVYVNNLFNLDESLQEQAVGIYQDLTDDCSCSYMVIDNKGKEAAFLIVDNDGADKQNLVQKLLNFKEDFGFLLAQNQPKEIEVILPDSTTVTELRVDSKQFWQEEYLNLAQEPEKATTIHYIEDILSVAFLDEKRLILAQDKAQLREFLEDSLLDLFLQSYSEDFVFFTAETLPLEWRKLFKYGFLINKEYMKVRGVIVF